MGISKSDDSSNAGGWGDVEGLPEPYLVVVPYPTCADILEVSGDDHGLKCDDGVRKAPAFGDRIVGNVCPDNSESARADVAVKEPPADSVLDVLIGDKEEVPGLAVDSAWGLAACLQDLVNLILGDWGLSIFPDGATGEELVDTVHGGCRGEAGYVCGGNPSTSLLSSGCPPNHLPGLIFRDKK